MAATPRELVYQTLDFAAPARAPRSLWTLPAARWAFADAVEALERDFPEDLLTVDGHHREQPPTQGDPYTIGTYVDPWGSVFTNIQAGMIGEVKDPLIQDWQQDLAKVHVPREWLTIDPDAVNRQCAESDRFCLAGCCPRPFEQLQFLRGTENLYYDLADPPDELLAFLGEMQHFYCELLEAWCRTDVDGLMFMDDWGSQQALLISPRSWRELFKPLYREYAEIAHGHGKRLFMHSDGHITAIYPDLIEIGIDALNSQLFCMGLEDLAPFAGKITFWGEIDRQHLLPHGTVAEIEAAVRDVHRHLWRDGGCFAQCEFGATAKPENVRAVFATWDRLTQTV